MNKNPWFRMYSEFATDPVVQCLSFDDQRHFVMLLCFKCAGLLDKEFPTAQNRTEVIRKTLGLDGKAWDEMRQRLQSMGLIDDKLQPKNWDKRQYVTDTSAKRTRKWRECNRHSDVTVTPPDTDTDTEKTCANRDAFALFWNSYPNKKNKKKAEAAFYRLTAKKQKLATDDCKRRYASTEKRFIPLPTTYIHGERWEDEIDTDKKITKEFVR